MVARSIELPLDEDGRVTIPINTRRELGIRPGDMVRLEKVSVAHEMESESDAGTPIPDFALGDDDTGQPPSFLKHIGSLTLVNQLGEDEDLEDRIREAKEEAAIQRYRRSQ